MELGPFLYFGASAGLPLPDLGMLKIAKHAKGNKDGIKAERQNIRVVPKGRFSQFESVEEIYEQLFQRI